MNTRLKFQKSLKTNYILHDYQQLAVILSTFILCFGTTKVGQETMGTNAYLVVALAVLFAFCPLIKAMSKGKELWFFWAVCLLEIPIQYLANENYYSVKNAIGFLFTFILMILVIVFSVKEEYAKCIWNVINFFSLVNASIIIIQYIARLVGIRLDTIGGIPEFFFNAWEFQNGLLFRPNAMYSEPSHFSEIALLSFFYVLFIDKNYKKTVLIGFALLLSTSTLGILGAVIVLILYILGLEKVSAISLRYKWIIIGIFIIGGIVVLEWANSSDSIIVNRVLSGGSYKVRVMRSFELFAIENFGEKVIGIGLQNQELYLNWNSIILPSDNYETMTKNREFSQTFGYLLCTTGIVGFASIVIPFCRMAMKNTWRVKSLLLLFFVVTLSCCIAGRVIFLVYLLAIYSLIEMEKNKR